MRQTEAQLRLWPSASYALLSALAKDLRARLPRVALELRGELLTPAQGVALVPASAQSMTVTGAVYRRLLGATHNVEIAMYWRRRADTPALRAALDVIRGELKALRSGHSRQVVRASLAAVVL